MKPKVKTYLDVYQYLQDQYKFLKETKAGFSYDSWAKELEASDKSYVRLMVLGKRLINDRMTVAFARSLSLSADEELYFNYLVQYTQSKTRAVREALGKKLLTLIEADLDQAEVLNHFEFLSNPILPRLQVLLSFHDLDQSAKNLSWLLGVESAEVENAIETLLRLRLISIEGERYQPLKRSFKVSDNFKDLGLQAFYVQNLEASKEAIGLPSSTRRFKSLFLPLNESEFTEFWESFETFTREQLVKYNSDEYCWRRLYQTHFNIIPVAANV